MTHSLVLITGATGHIGFKTLVVALQAGYSVRAAVRSEAKQEQVLAAPSIKALNPGSELTFVIIPDLTVEGAYYEAVKGVKYIIHIASPIVLKGEVKPENFQKELIDPAVSATTSILKAAAKTTVIKRIVITSSVVALIDSKYILDETAPEGVVFDHNSRTTLQAPPYPTDFHAYNASKVAALEATDTFIWDEKPAFDIVNISPSFVVGKNELITDAKEATLGTNVTALGVVLGNRLPYPIFGNSVHVDDGLYSHSLHFAGLLLGVKPEHSIAKLLTSPVVAFMQVKALDPKVPAGTYIANSDGTVWQDATKIVAESFPETVTKGVLPNNGVHDTRPAKIDAKRSEEVFGFKFKTYKDQVKSIVSHYLELLGEKVA